MQMRALAELDIRGRGLRQRNAAKKTREQEAIGF
jgi:hypothetical protein